MPPTPGEMRSGIPPGAPILGSVITTPSSTKVWHLDANRATVDIYNLGWKPYLAQRETDERGRKQERPNTERKIDALSAQAVRASEAH
jgi:hypothetical protein